MHCLMKAWELNVPPIEMMVRVVHPHVASVNPMSRTWDIFFLIPVIPEINDRIRHQKFEDHLKRNSDNYANQLFFVIDQCVFL